MPLTVPEIQAALEAGAVQFAAVETKVAKLTGFGRIFYVDPAGGDDAAVGTAWDTAWQTMEHALDSVDAFDTIAFSGTLSEGGLVLDVPGVTIIGAGPTPASNTWQQAAVDTDLITINAINCRLMNIKFRPPAYSASGHPKAVSLSGAYQAQIVDCLFQGRAASHYAIYTDGNNANVRIARCVFMYLNTATHGHAIAGGSYAVGENSGWIIEDCLFHSNVNHIVARMRQSLIQRCHFGHYGLAAAGGELTTTKKIDISGATGGWNRVHGNFLEGAYTNTGGYYNGTNDNWAGNHSHENGGTYVSVGGLTLTVPQAA